MRVLKCEYENWYHCEAGGRLMRAKNHEPCYLNSNDIYSDGEPIIGRVIPPWILTPLQPLFRAKLHDMPVCIGEKSKARVWVIKDLQIFLLILIGRRHVLKVDQTANPPRPVKASSVPDSIVFR